MSKWSNTRYRAIRTFFQAFCSYIVANLVTTIISAEGITRDVIIGVLTTAFAAGLGALMNLPGKNEDITFEETTCPTKQKHGVEDINELPLAGQDRAEELAEYIEDEIGRQRGATDDE